MPEFPSPTTVAIPGFVFFVALEYWAVKTGRAKGRYETADALTSLAMGLGNVVVNTLTGFIGVALFMAFWDYRIYEFPMTGAGFWLSFALCFVLYDFVYYWKHRFAHRVRWFWAEHITHHSSRHYNLTTALRQPWYGPLTGLIIVGAPMALIGFHPALIFFAGGVNLVYQFWIHTESIDRLPAWVEAIFNTPSHHRVHHGTNPRYLDANYAGVFIVWDKMFGSFVPELDEDRPEYGLVKNISSYNPIFVAYHELAALMRDCARDGFKPIRWIKRFANPPGWSPDGAHERSVDLKRAYLVSHPAAAGTPGLPRRLAAPAPQSTRSQESVRIQ
ncbi:MAG: sterol desaturase family protein [Pseudomonadota bacterium]